jgi:hypothetical protein
LDDVDAGGHRRGQDAREQILMPAVRIRVEQRHGDGSWLTCRHLCRARQRRVVSQWANDPVRGKSFWYADGIASGNERRLVMRREVIERGTVLTSQ